MMLTNSSAPFPEMRTAWLRAIAKYWRHPEFGGLLLQKSSQSTSAPWKPGDRGILDILEQDQDINAEPFPFSKVRVLVSQQSPPQWQPVGTRGWFGLADTFVISLPTRPKDSADEAQLVAEYCQNFPSLLGRGQLGHEAPPDFAWFGLITARLIALSWHPPPMYSDDQMKHMLFDPDDARELVQNLLDCLIPWDFRIKFQPAEAIPFVLQADRLTNHSYYDWAKFPPTDVILNLPEKPGSTSDHSQEAIALAAYNDTGGQFPFTCP